MAKHSSERRGSSQLILPKGFAEESPTSISTPIAALDELYHMSGAKNETYVELVMTMPSHNAVKRPACKDYLLSSDHS